MDADELLKAGCMRALEHFGFEAWSIPPVPGARSPDFGARLAGQEFIFELKERLDDPAQLASEHEALARGDIASSVESIGPNDRISEKCKDGVQQLKAHPSGQDTFRLLWLHAGGRDSEFQLDQFRSTLYGIENMYGLNLSGLKRCYYFHESAFFRHRADLAAAIISTSSSLQLCINSQFVRAADFRASALVQALQKGLLDPSLAESEGLIYIADCVNDRRDKQATLDYLSAKYRCGSLMDFPLHKVSASVVPGSGV